MQLSARRTVSCAPAPTALCVNPIYTSMLLVLSATGLILASWPPFLLSLVLFAVGTQVRVATEEELFAKRLGKEFLTYKREAPAYVPRF
jgi:protein-S-isoprenylcysteine O-methyltransferase Ste14